MHTEGRYRCQSVLASTLSINLSRVSVHSPYNACADEEINIECICKKANADSACVCDRMARRPLWLTASRTFTAPPPPVSHLQLLPAPARSAFQSPLEWH